MAKTARCVAELPANQSHASRHHVPVGIGHVPRAASHGGRPRSVRQKIHDLPEKVLPVADLDPASLLQQFPRGLGNVGPMRPEEHGLAPPRGLDEIVSSRRHQAAAHESNVGAAIVLRQVAQGVQQQDSIIPGLRTTHLATLEVTQLPLPEQPLDLAKPLRVPWGENHEKSRIQTAQLGKNAQKDFFLAAVGASRHNHGTTSLADVRRFRKRPRFRCGILERPGYGDLEGVHTEAQHAAGILVILHAKTGNFVQHRPEELPETLIHPRAPGRQAAAEDHGGNSQPVGHADEVRPDLRFQ